MCEHLRERWKHGWVNSGWLLCLLGLGWVLGLGLRIWIVQTVNVHPGIAACRDFAISGFCPRSPRRPLPTGENISISLSEKNRIIGREIFARRRPLAGGNCRSRPPQAILLELLGRCRRLVCAFWHISGYISTVSFYPGPPLPYCRAFRPSVFQDLDFGDVLK